MGGPSVCSCWRSGWRRKNAGMALMWDEINTLGERRTSEFLINQLRTAKSRVARDQAALAANQNELSDHDPDSTCDAVVEAKARVRHESGTRQTSWPRARRCWISGNGQRTSTESSNPLMCNHVVDAVTPITQTMAVTMAVTGKKKVSIFGISRRRS